MSEAYQRVVDSTIQGRVVCGRHWKDGRPARKYVLRWPQPESTPLVLRYEVQRGPELWMCDECAEEAKEWSELKKEDN